MLKQCILDLGREVVLAAPNDHLLHTARDFQIAARVHRAQIASVQPAIGVNRCCGCFGIIVVFQHQQIAADTDLALHTQWHHRIVIDRADRNARLRHRLSNRIADIVQRLA